MSEMEPRGTVQFAEIAERSLPQTGGERTVSTSDHLLWYRPSFAIRAQRHSCPILVMKPGTSSRMVITG